MKKKNIKFFILISLALSFLVGYKLLQKDTVPLPKADSILLYNHKLELIRELDTNQTKQLLGKLQHVQPYIFLNPSGQDEPTEADVYYKLVLQNQEEDIATIFLYEENEEAVLMKPYHYTVYLKYDLDKLLSIK